MIITFCGHSQCYEDRDLHSEIYKILKTYIKNDEVEFLLGDYGMFDRIARSVCEQYKNKVGKSKLTFVSPYSNDIYLKRRESEKYYDEILSPELNVPVKYAIIKRNKYMVDKADLIIAYINYPFGGAYKTFMYALKTNKKIINLGKL